MILFSVWIFKVSLNLFLDLFNFAVSRDRGLNYLIKLRLVHF